MRAVIVFLLTLALSQFALAKSKYSLNIEKAEKEELARQIKEFDALPKWKQRKLKKESEAEAAKGEAAFEAEKYEEALEHYGKSLDLYPKNQQSVYRRAITAFRNGDMGWAVTYLKLTESKDIDETEKAYFLGLSYYELKDYEKALEHLANVKASGNKDLAPSAAYYNAFYLFKQKDYALAKSEFQYVLDTSDNPALDDKAEKYIELIIRLLQKKHKDDSNVFLSAFVGFQHDSNILFNPESVSDQGSALNEGGERVLTVGDARWRFLNKQNHEMSLKANGVYVLSFEEVFERADPFIAGIELPYSFKSKLFGKSYRLDISPGYEILHLDAQDDGGRENILNTVKLGLNNTLVMSRTWFSNYNLTVRSEDSKLEISDEADDASALKTSLATTQTFILDKKKGRIVNGGAKYTLNSADGDNNDYYRFDVSGLYTQNLGFWDLSGAASLTYYRLVYTKRADDRKDNNIAATLSLSKPLAKWLTLVLNGGYTDNNSNVDANTYDKFTLMLGASAKYSF